VPSVRFHPALKQLAVAGFCLSLLACTERSDDPTLAALAADLGPGDRLIETRVLDPPAGDRIVAVVQPSEDPTELRIYERRNGGEYAVVHRSRQGDRFRHLELEDVTTDGREEILITWAGGHLEILEILARADDGTYSPLLQDAGREIEKRYGPGGRIEFWITSRTYAENSGQPPVYDTTVYRWDGRAFADRTP
jgi:hypothetical protein